MAAALPPVEELDERAALTAIDPTNLPLHYFVRGVGAVLDFCPRGWYHAVLEQVNQSSLKYATI